MHALLLLPTHLIIKLRFGFTMSGCLPFVLAPSPGMPIGVASCAALGVLTWRRHARREHTAGVKVEAGRRRLTVQPRVERPYVVGYSSCVSIMLHASSALARRVQCVASGPMPMVRS